MELEDEGGEAESGKSHYGGVSKLLLGHGFPFI
jgi:hypothetical protein